MGEEQARAIQDQENVGQEVRKMERTLALQPEWQQGILLVLPWSETVSKARVTLRIMGQTEQIGGDFEVPLRDIIAADGMQLKGPFEIRAGTRRVMLNAELSVQSMQ